MREWMSTWTRTLVLGTVCFSMTAGVVYAEEEKPSAELGVGVYSTYVWRGFGLSDDSLVIQPGMTVGYKGFGVNLWGNLDTDQAGMESESFNWNETDVTLSYDGAAGMLGYSVGWIYYDLEGIEDTQEVYLGASLDTILAPSLTLYMDIANVPGYYVSLGIGHSIAMGEGLALDLGASIGFMDDDADYSELHDGLISVSMTFPVGEYLSISPELYYSFALSSEASDYIEAVSVTADDNYIYGGVSASFAF